LDDIQAFSLNPMMDAAQQLKVDPAQAALLLRRATIAAVTVAVLLVSLKFYAYSITGSVAMLGTLFDSVLDGAASLLNLVAVHHALKPADAGHRFGHGKAEALSGLVQSTLIFGSACFIAYQAVKRFLENAPVEGSGIGIGILLIAMLMTLALVAYQTHVISRTGSTAIAADSLHYRGDLLMNFAALLALAAAGFLGWQWADPLFGLLIAGLIAYGAVQILRSAYNQLMDHELSDAARKKIHDIALAHDKVINIHDLRTRKSGMHMFVQFHVELAGDILLLDANRIAHEVEDAIVKVFPGAEIIIHTDPVEKATDMASQRAFD